MVLEPFSPFLNFRYDMKSGGKKKKRHQATGFKTKKGKKEEVHLKLMFAYFFSPLRQGGRGGKGKKEGGGTRSPEPQSKKKGEKGNVPPHP